MRVGLLGLDAAVTSHVEWITTDVIKAEITKLEAELAGHDPDGETNTHPARQPGTPALAPPQSRSETEARIIKIAPQEEPAIPVNDHG